jgi:stearoyl-CoA desaturase (delta-9 desaturase)
MLTTFIIVFLISYTLHAMGVTIGYHRLLSHRSFACNKAAEYFWVLAGYLAFEGSPIWWATIHRAHHRYVDTPLDPHAPKYGLFNAHFGWLMKTGYSEHVNPQAQAKDLINDPVYKFLEQGGDWHRAHRIAFAIGLAFRLLILVTFGWVPALASLLAGVAVLQIPLMLNVICHIPKLGYKTYAGEDDSVNVWWVGLLAFGEGWHNNHHAFPGSAKTGIKFFELDMSWLTILLMKRLGIVSRVNVITEKRAPISRTIPSQPRKLRLVAGSLASARRQKCLVPVAITSRSKSHLARR